MEQWVRDQFDVIKQLLGDDPHTIRSFLGYAPVLEALAVFFNEDAGDNTMQALQHIKKKDGSIEIYVCIPGLPSVVNKRMISKEKFNTLFVLSAHFVWQTLHRIYLRICGAKCNVICDTN